MANVIDLLEKMAANVEFSNEEVFLREIDNSEIDEELKVAIKNKDQSAIELILGSNTNLMSILVPAEDDEPDNDDDKKEETNRRVG